MILKLNEMEIRVNSVPFAESYEPAIRDIRGEVFTGEQNVPQNHDFDGQDPQAHHVLVSVDGEFIATGRMLSDGHIGRIAVRKPFRQQGYGERVVRQLIKVAQQQKYPRVYLGSQLHAIPFYQKLGFTCYGDEYVEANIRHRSMEYLLTADESSTI